MAPKLSEILDAVIVTVTMLFEPEEIESGCSSTVLYEVGGVTPSEATRVLLELNPWSSSEPV
jgi:hypothetical protein